MKIVIINGPNLRSLGKREISLYGTMTYPQIVDKILDFGDNLGIEVDIFQSNHEGEIVDYIEEGSSGWEGIIINPGALTHQSYVLYDALLACGLPVIEVHLTNIYAREEFRAKSITARAAKAVICGMSYRGYLMAMEYLKDTCH